jgi:hypothetical protein
MTAKNEKDEDAAEIRRLLIDYHAAMVEADIEKLSGLLDMDFFLVHITGYTEPKDEWFDVIRTGQFAYHKIDIESNQLSVSVTGVTAVVAGRGIFNATINSMRNPWRLQFKMTCAKRENGWRVTSARYTSF